MSDHTIITERYSAMTDGELENFALEDGMGLTPEAFQILKSEFYKRKLNTSILDEISDGTLTQKSESLKKIENTINSENSKSILSNALNEKRDGKNNIEIFTSLVENGMDETNAQAIISNLKKHALTLHAQANSSILTAVFITIAGIALYMINPSVANNSFTEIISICAIMFGVLKFLKAFSPKISMRLSLGILTANCRMIFDILILYKPNKEEERIREGSQGGSKGQGI